MFLRVAARDEAGGHDAQGEAARGRRRRDFAGDAREQGSELVILSIGLQGTAEGRPFDRAAVDALLDLANAGLERLFEQQAEALAKVRR